jgi:UrcA family protein
MSRKTLIAALAATALGVCTAAVAAPLGQPYDPDTVAVKVSLADLNLNHEPGAQIALRRIYSAAHEVCGAEPTPSALREANLYRTCLKTTADRAVATLDSPLVTAANAGPTRLQVAGR